MLNEGKETKDLFSPFWDIRFLPLFLGYLQPFYKVGQDKKCNNDLQSIDVR